MGNGVTFLIDSLVMNLQQTSIALLFLMMNIMANLISAPRINGGGVGGSGSFIDAPSMCLSWFRGLRVMIASQFGLSRFSVKDDIG